MNIWNTPDPIRIPDEDIVWEDHLLAEYGFDQEDIPDTDPLVFDELSLYVSDDDLSVE